MSQPLHQKMKQKAQSARKESWISAAVLPDSLKADNYQADCLSFLNRNGTDGPNLLKSLKKASMSTAKSEKFWLWKENQLGTGRWDRFLSAFEWIKQLPTGWICRQNEKLLKTAKWVNIYENKPCQHKRKRWIREIDKFSLTLRHKFPTYKPLDHEWIRIKKRRMQPSLIWVKTFFWRVLESKPAELVEETQLFAAKECSPIPAPSLLIQVNLQDVLQTR